MKAVVLAGGRGTRLRPLTETVKKELLPLVDRAILHHNLDRLVRHGVHEVVMSSSYLQESFEPFVHERAGDPAIEWITEPSPLDTAGAIIQALDAVGDETFFAMNGDVITDLDLTAMLGFHSDRGAVATIALHLVQDARAFGLVATDRDGRVREFREKPTELVPGHINAGTYLLDPSVFDAWSVGEVVSIERDVFPALIASGRPVFGFVGDGYWMDLGTPEKYLQAHIDALAGSIRDLSYPAPYLGPGAMVDPGAHVGPSVVVGPAAFVGAGAHVERSVILEGASVGPNAHVSNSILGPGAYVGSGATLARCVLGQGASVPIGASLLDARVPPFTEARASD